MKRILLAALAICIVTSARAAIIQYGATLNGANAGTGSLGTGTGTAIYDNVAHSLQLQVSWTGLTGNTTVSHIHGPTTTPLTGTASVVLTPTTLPGFPVGVTSGNYAITLDMTQTSTYPAAFVTANGGTAAGAEAAIMSAMAAGRTYWNIHSSTSPGGEINGFLITIPEPSSLALLGLGFAGMAGRIWRKKAPTTH